MLSKWLTPLYFCFLLFGAAVQAESSASSDSQTAALTQLQTQAKAGHKEAQRDLGLAYLKGEGIAKDTARAYDLFVQAARQQDAQAQFYLGRSYLTGKGTDRNLISAYIWLSASAAKTSPLQEDAKSLRNQVSEQLNETQLDKAELLVQQLEDFYLP